MGIPAPYERAGFDRDRGGPLTSELMRLAEFPDDDRPLSLAIALRLESKPVERQAVPDHGGQ